MWGTYYGKKMLYVHVNAKNSFGAYVGAKLSGCLVNEKDEPTIFCYPIFQDCINNILYPIESISKPEAQPVTQ